MERNRQGDIETEKITRGNLTKQHQRNQPKYLEVYSSEVDIFFYEGIRNYCNWATFSLSQMGENIRALVSGAPGNKAKQNTEREKKMVTVYFLHPQHILRRSAIFPFSGIRRNYFTGWRIVTVHPRLSPTLPSAVTKTRQLRASIMGLKLQRVSGWETGIAGGREGTYWGWWGWRQRCKESARRSWEITREWTSKWQMKHDSERMEEE